jgi:hypothetical protein
MSWCRWVSDKAYDTAAYAYSWADYLATPVKPIAKAIYKYQPVTPIVRAIYQYEPVRHARQGFNQIFRLPEIISVSPQTKQILKQSLDTNSGYLLSVIASERLVHKVLPHYVPGYSETTGMILDLAVFAGFTARLWARKYVDNNCFAPSLPRAVSNDLAMYVADGYAEAIASNLWPIFKKNFLRNSKLGDELEENAYSAKFTRDLAIAFENFITQPEITADSFKQFRGILANVLFKTLTDAGSSVDIDVIRHYADTLSNAITSELFAGLLVSFPKFVKEMKDDNYRLSLSSQSSSSEKKFLSKITSKMVDEKDPISQALPKTFFEKKYVTYLNGFHDEIKENGDRLEKTIQQMGGESRKFKKELRKIANSIKTDSQAVFLNSLSKEFLNKASPNDWATLFNEVKARETDIDRRIQLRASDDKEFSQSLKKIANSYMQNPKGPDFDELPEAFFKKCPINFLEEKEDAAQSKDEKDFFTKLNQRRLYDKNKMLAGLSKSFVEKNAKEVSDESMQSVIRSTVTVSRTHLKKWLPVKNATACECGDKKKITASLSSSYYYAGNLVQLKIPDLLRKVGAISPEAHMYATVIAFLLRALIYGHSMNEYKVVGDGHCTRHRYQIFARNKAHGFGVGLSYVAISELLSTLVESVTGVNTYFSRDAINSLMLQSVAVSTLANNEPLPGKGEDPWDIFYLSRKLTLWAADVGRWLFSPYYNDVAKRQRFVDKMKRLAESKEVAGALRYLFNGNDFFPTKESMKEVTLLFHEKFKQPKNPEIDDDEDNDDKADEKRVIKNVAPSDASKQIIAEAKKELAKADDKQLIPGAKKELVKADDKQLIPEAKKELAKADDKQLIPGAKKESEKASAHLPDPFLIIMGIPAVQTVLKFYHKDVLAAIPKVESLHGWSKWVDVPYVLPFINTFFSSITTPLLVMKDPAIGNLLKRIDAQATQLSLAARAEAASIPRAGKSSGNKSEKVKLMLPIKVDLTKPRDEKHLSRLSHVASLSEEQMRAIESAIEDAISTEMNMQPAASLDKPHEPVKKAKVAPLYYEESDLNKIEDFEYNELTPHAARQSKKKSMLALVTYGVFGSSGKPQSMQTTPKTQASLLLKNL